MRQLKQENIFHRMKERQRVRERMWKWSAIMTSDVRCGWIDGIGTSRSLVLIYVNMIKLTNTHTHTASEKKRFFFFWITFWNACNPMQTVSSQWIPYYSSLEWLSQAVLFPWNWWYDVACRFKLHSLSPSLSSRFEPLSLSRALLYAHSHIHIFFIPVVLWFLSHLLLHSFYTLYWIDNFINDALPPIS